MLHIIISLRLTYLLTLMLLVLQLQERPACKKLPS